MIKLVLEGNPFSVNKTYCPGRKKGIRLTEEAIAYGNLVGWQAKIQMKALKKGPLSQKLDVTYIYYLKQNSGDHLNFSKKLNDSLEQIVWQNDKQIKSSHHYTQIDPKNPRIVIFIKIIEDVKIPQEIIEKL